MNNHHGFTLLEILVSLFLLSITLLAVNAAQITSLQQSRGLYYFQQASILADNMAEYLSAHHGNINNYQQTWNDDINLILPDAAGQLSGQFPAYRITINWGGTKQNCQHNQPGVVGCVVLSTK
jgi:prepilin-type N-terminal cleavage/methylation domain-containing protein